MPSATFHTRAATRSLARTKTLVAMFFFRVANLLYGLYILENYCIISVSDWLIDSLLQSTEVSKSIMYSIKRESLNHQCKRLQRVFINSKKGLPSISHDQATKRKPPVSKQECKRKGLPLISYSTVWFVWWELHSYPYNELMTCILGKISFGFGFSNIRYVLNVL